MENTWGQRASRILRRPILPRRPGESGGGQVPHSRPGEGSPDSAGSDAVLSSFPSPPSTDSVKPSTQRPLGAGGEAVAVRQVHPGLNCARRGRLPHPALPGRAGGP